MDEDDSSKYNDSFNFIHFIKFLDDHNIIATSIAAVLSERINEVTNIFVEYMVMPIINRDADNDGVKDIKKLEDIQITIFNTKFKAGVVMLAFLKFVIITYIIFIIAKCIRTVIKI